MMPMSTHSLNSLTSSFYFEYRKYYGSKSKFRHTMINIKECWNCRLSNQDKTISALKFKFELKPLNKEIELHWIFGQDELWLVQYDLRDPSIIKSRWKIREPFTIAYESHPSLDSNLIEHTLLLMHEGIVPDGQYKV